MLLYCKRMFYLKLLSFLTFFFQNIVSKSTGFITFYILHNAVSGHCGRVVSKILFGTENQEIMFSPPSP
jgi:hypothetical protein